MRLLALLLLAPIALSACQPAQEPPAISVAAPSSALAAQLDAYLSSRNPSGAFLFAVGDEIVFNKGYGVLTEGGAPIPADAVFPIGSVSKQFTAAAILQLAERRKLSLDDPISKFFPAVPADKAAITVQQLLAHNSGLPRNVHPFQELHTREETLGLIFAAAMGTSPGKHHSYSNAGYMLLARIVEIASGMRFDRYLERNLFRPAGLTMTGFPGPRFRGVPMPRGYDRPKYDEVYSGTPMDEANAGKDWYNWGPGGLLSTVSDLLRWQRALAAGKIISPAYLKEMLSPHGVITPDGKYRYGYGWVIQDSNSGPMLWHNGVWYSYYTELRVFPEVGVVGIGFTNRQQDERFDETFGTALRQVLAAAKPASASS